MRAVVRGTPSPCILHYNNYKLLPLSREKRTLLSSLWLWSPFLIRNPSLRCAGNNVEPWYVRLDIKQRSFVKDIYPFYLQNVLVSSYELYN